MDMKALKLNDTKMMCMYAETRVGIPSAQGCMLSSAFEFYDEKDRCWNTDIWNGCTIFY